MSYVFLREVVTIVGWNITPCRKMFLYYYAPYHFLAAYITHFHKLLVQNSVS